MERAERVRVLERASGEPVSASVQRGPTFSCFSLFVEERLTGFRPWIHTLASSSFVIARVVSSHHQ